LLDASACQLQLLYYAACRYEAERGPGCVSVFTRLSVNCFGDDSPAQLAAAVDAAVERSRVALLGPEAAAAGGCLDLVQLAWLDYKVCHTA
jgi:hypothetical protein